MTRLSKLKTVFLLVIIIYILTINTSASPFSQESDQCNSPTRHIETCHLTTAHVISRYPSLGVFYSSKAPERQWETELIENVYVLGSPNVALDTEGNPNAIYYSTTEDDIRFARKIGESWEIESIESFFSSSFLTPDIAIDSLNRPHISYYNSEERKLKYAKKTRSQWQISTIDISDNIGHISIELDESNIPHIAYVKKISESAEEIKYATKSGETWSVETVQSNNYYGNREISIALNNQESPSIVWSEITPEITHNKVQYAEKTDTNNWDIETIFEGGPIAHAENPSGVSLDLDTRNNPHIAYGISNNQGRPLKLYYIKKEFGNWTSPELVNQFDGASFALTPSLKVDYNDKPLIVDRNHQEEIDEIRLFSRTAQGSWNNELIIVPSVSPDLALEIN